jgi:hypothetical protein
MEENAPAADEIDAVVRTLDGFPPMLTRLVHEAPPDVRARRPRTGKWSIHEHACHLAAVHPLFFERLDLMLRHHHPRITPSFPGPGDQDGALLRVDLEEALDRFAADRHWLVQRLRGLRPADWQRTAEHGEYNRYSVFILFRHVAMHDHLHAYRIEELVLSRDWGDAP